MIYIYPNGYIYALQDTHWKYDYGSSNWMQINFMHYMTTVFAWLSFSQEVETENFPRFEVSERIESEW